MNKDIVLFVGAFVLALLATGYVHATGNIVKLRANWSENRCNPLYMPFASWIDETVDTADNFQHCIGILGKDVLAAENDVFGTLMSILNEALSVLLSPLKLVRGIITRIRKFVLSFTTSTIGKATGPVSMFGYYLNKIQDILRRFVGQGYIAAMFGATTVGLIESFVTVVITVIKGFVMAMLAISVILALFQPELLVIVLTLASLLSAAGA
jgi:hypothetical protein